MDEAEKRQVVRRIVAAYGTPLVRLYSRIRFLILHAEFLDEMGQYLPESGLVLDIGCGYGLSALYFATQFPQLKIRGMDVNPRRIKMAQEAAARLGLENVEFHAQDAAEFVCDEAIEGAYMLDLIHHVRQESVRHLFEPIAQHMSPGRRLVVKDIEPRPLHRLAYVWLMDKMMDYRAPLHYWSSPAVQELLRSLGFDVYRHSVLDHLPSPHVVYIAVKKEGSSG